MEHEELRECALCGDEFEKTSEGIIEVVGDLRYNGVSLLGKTFDEDRQHYVCINCLIEALEQVRVQAIESITKKMSKEQERLDKLMISMVKEPKSSLDIPEFLKKQLLPGI